jgi:hypothetical protein
MVREISGSSVPASIVSTLRARRSTSLKRPVMVCTSDSS